MNAKRPKVGAGAVDLDSLRARAQLAAAAAGLGSVRELTELSVGGASLTYRGILESAAKPEPFVLKLAPPGVEPVRNRDVLRQARIMRILASSAGINVPTILCEDPGRPVDSPPFFMMTFEPGESLEPILRSDQALPAPNDVSGRALHAARMLADLHSLDMGSPELAAEPRIALLEEVERWTSALGTVDGQLRDGADEVESALRAHLPESFDPVVLHGDYRLGNMLCSGPEVVAIIDWELWSISDPRLDLAWFRLHTRSAANRFAFREAPGMPGPDEVVAAYESVSGREINDMVWFDALVRYKQAAAAALIVKHARRREGPNAAGDMAKAIPHQLRDARALIT